MRFLLLIVLFVSPVLADGVRTSISWNKVTGNNGYIVEVTNEKGETIFRKTLENEKIEFSLNPGIYSFRIATLNKFKKPSLWSSWRSFSLDASGKKQDVAVPASVQKNQEKVPDQKASEIDLPVTTVKETDKKSQVKSEEKNASLLWNVFVPVYPETKRNDTWKAWSVAGVYSVLVLSALNEKNLGNHFAASAEANSMHMILYSSFQPVIPYTFYYWDRYHTANQKYQMRQETQRQIAGAILLFYAGNVFYEWRKHKAFSISLKASVDSNEIQVSHSLFSAVKFRY